MLFKRIIILTILIATYFVGSGQGFINKQTTGSSTTISDAKGAYAADSAYIITNLGDTAYGRQINYYDGTGGKGFGLLGYNGFLYYRYNGAWVKIASSGIIPAQFNPLQGWGVVLSGTYPNVTFTVDSVVVASKAELQKKVDSLGGVKLNTGDTINLSNRINARVLYTDSNTVYYTPYGISLNYYNKTLSDARFVQLTRNINTNLPLLGGGNLSGGLTLRADTGRGVSQLATGGGLNKVKDTLVNMISAGGFGTVLSVATTSGTAIISSVATPSSTPNISIKVDTTVIHTWVYDSVNFYPLNSNPNRYWDSVRAKAWSNATFAPISVVNFDTTVLNLTTRFGYKKGWGDYSATGYGFTYNNLTGAFTFDSSKYITWLDTTGLIATKYNLSLYQPIGSYVPTTRTLTINGVTYDLSANRTWNVGTVTSVGLSLPSMFSVSGSPVTSSGTLSASLANQNANLVFASATSGSLAQPTFRSLVSADIPVLGIANIDTSASGISSRQWRQKGIDSAVGLINLKFNVSDTALVGGTHYYNKAYIDGNLALKVNYTDTSTMLSPYQRSAFAVKYSDTTAMLSGYYRTSNPAGYITSAAIAGKVNYSDTAGLVSGYQRKLTLTTNNVNGVSTLDTYGNLNIPHLDTTYIHATLAEVHKSAIDSMKTVYAATYQPIGAYLTGITADAPLSGAGTSASHLVISTANTTTTGALSSTDWNTFNGKQAAYTNLTSIGSLTNAAGWLYNNGTGTFSYSTPTAAQVGAPSGSGTSTGTNTGDNAVNSNYSGLVASQTANYFYAAPNGVAGTPTFRAIVAADIPTLNQNTTGTAANATTWNSQSYYGAYSSGVVQRALIYNISTGGWEGVTAAPFQTFLGLGSNAYTSTAYLPLVAGSGSSLTGDLYVNSNTITITGASSGTLWLKHSAAGIDQKQFLIRTASGLTTMKALNDASSAYPYTFFTFNHSNGNITAGGALTGTTASFNAGTIAGVYSYTFQANSSFIYSGSATRLSTFTYNAGDKPGVELGYDTTNHNGIIAGATQAIGSGIDFWTYNGTAWGSRLLIAKSGVATFSNSVISNVGLSATAAASNSVAAGSYLALVNPSNSYQGLLQLNASYGIDMWFFNGAWNNRITFANSGNISTVGSITASSFIGNLNYSITFNNSGSGAASGTAFNNSAAQTISYNTIGAQPLATNLTSLAALSYVSGAYFVKMTSAGTFSLDNSTYLTTAVTSLTGGTDISVSASTGAVTVNNTSTLATVTGRGATTSTAVTFNGGVSVSSTGITLLNPLGNSSMVIQNTGGSGVSLLAISSNVTAPAYAVSGSSSAYLLRGDGSTVLASTYALATSSAITGYYNPTVHVDSLNCTLVSIDSLVYIINGTSQSGTVTVSGKIRLNTSGVGSYYYVFGLPSYISTNAVITHGGGAANPSANASVFGVIRVSGISSNKLNIAGYSTGTLTNEDMYFSSTFSYFVP